MSEIWVWCKECDWEASADLVEKLVPFSEHDNVQDVARQLAGYHSYGCGDSDVWLSSVLMMGENDE